MNLNPAQAQAVHARAQDMLVLACAGAGKTRVLIERIATLVETNTPPWAIAAVTFTNKAADEMREVGPIPLVGSQRPWIYSEVKR